MAIIIVANIWGKGMIKIIPILLGVVVAYIVAVIANACGATVAERRRQMCHRPCMDFSAVRGAQHPGAAALPYRAAVAKFDLTAILVMAPIAIASMMEHIGDMSAISATVGKNFIQDPGLHRTLIGDGIATSLAGTVRRPRQHHLRREYRRAGPLPGP